MKFVGWGVRPVVMVMVNDEENLTQVVLNEQIVAAAQWDAFKAGGDAQALDLVRKQIEAGARPEVSEPPKPAARPTRRNKSSTRRTR